jgi:hypothetical protein
VRPAVLAGRVSGIEKYEIFLGLGIIAFHAQRMSPQDVTEEVFPHNSRALRQLAKHIQAFGALVFSLNLA